MAGKGDGTIYKREVKRSDGSKRTFWHCQIVERVGGKTQRKSF